jgi:hypothetical protein
MSADAHLVPASETAAPAFSFLPKLASECGAALAWPLAPTHPPEGAEEAAGRANPLYAFLTEGSSAPVTLSQSATPKVSASAGISSNGRAPRPTPARISRPRGRIATRASWWT